MTRSTRARLLLGVGHMKFKCSLFACVLGFAIAGCSDHQDTRRSTMPPAGGEASGYNGTAGTSTEQYQARPGTNQQTRSQSGVTGTGQYDQNTGTSSDVGNDPSGAGMSGTTGTGSQPGTTGTMGSRGTGTSNPSGTSPTTGTGPYNGPNSGQTTGTGTSGSTSSGSASSPRSSNTGVNSGSTSTSGSPTSGPSGTGTSTTPR